MHMRCAAHILNLIVKDGLDVIQPAIKKIRDSVAFWTATPKRVEKFEEMAKFVKVSLVLGITLIPNLKIFEHNAVVKLQLLKSSWFSSHRNPFLHFTNFSLCKNIELQWDPNMETLEFYHRAMSVAFFHKIDLPRRFFQIRQ